MIIARVATPRRRSTADPVPLVMVVDDDDDTRNTLVEILEHLKYDVAEAKHGLEAFTQLRTGVRPSVILLDLMMPVMDGFEFVAEVRKQPAYAEIPILVITAAGNAAAEAAKVSVAGSVQKPFHTEELLSAIRQAVGQTS
jgi:CheY-like chemotaxis protein